MIGTELHESGGIDFASLWEVIPEPHCVVERKNGAVVILNAAFRKLFARRDSTPVSLPDLAVDSAKEDVAAFLKGPAGTWKGFLEFSDGRLECRLWSSRLSGEPERILLRLQPISNIPFSSFAPTNNCLLVEKELLESEKRLKILGKATHDVVWDWNLETNEVWWNENMQLLFGYTPEELNFSFRSLIHRIHPDDETRIITGINKFVAEGGEYWSDEYRMKKKDGSYLRVLDRGFVMHDTDNKPVRMIGAMMDITQRTKDEEQIRKLNLTLEKRVKDRTAELEAANRELETFSYSVSHDLRAPLRAIEGFARILAEDYGASLDEEGQKYLKIISENTQEMSSLIDDLLSFSRLGRQNLRLSPVQVTVLAREIIEELRKLNPTRNLEFKVGELPEIMADRILLKQVLVNLLSNAVKFTARKAVGIIELGSFAKGENVVYSIKDNGAGFEMKYAEKLFGVFQRLHKVEEFQGHGVGLAIVQRLVRKHHGEVWAEGKVNEGATFYVCLPRGE